MDFADAERHVRDRSRSPQENYGYVNSDMYRPAQVDYRERSPSRNGSFGGPIYNYGPLANSSRYIGARDAYRMPPVTGNSDQARRVYIGNLSYDVKWHHLKDFMRQAGDVLFADVLLLPNGMSKGCGIVEYRTPEAAQHAIQTLSNQNLMGRPIFVREDREAGPRGGMNSGPLARSGPRAKAIVSGLPRGTVWRDLKQFFIAQGRVPFETVGFVDDNTNSCEVILQPQNLDDFVNCYHGINFQGVTISVQSPDPSKEGIVGDNVPYNSMGMPPAGNMYGQGPANNGPLNLGLTRHATSGGDSSETIYVGNLPWATTRDDLLELFTTIGPVKDAGIIYYPNGRSCGSGVVQFDSPEHAAESIKRFNDYSYGNRPLKLSFVRYQTPSIPTGPSSMSVY